MLVSVKEFDRFDCARKNIGINLVKVLTNKIEKAFLSILFHNLLLAKCNVTKFLSSGVIISSNCSLELNLE